MNVLFGAVWLLLVLACLMLSAEGSKDEAP